MKLTFVTVSATAVKRLIEAEKAIHAELPGALELSVYYATAELPSDVRTRMIEDLASADFAFVDLMGTPPDAREAVNLGLDRCMGDILPYGNGAQEYLRLGRFTASVMKQVSGGRKPNMKAMGKTKASAEAAPVPPECAKDMRNYARIVKYFKVSDPQNIRSMLRLILRDYGLDGRVGTVDEPREVAPVAVTHPEGMTVYDSVRAYADAHGWVEGRPTVLVLFYAHLYPTDTSSAVLQIVRRLAQEHNVLPVAVSGASAETVGMLRAMLTEELPSPPDAVLNFMSFRLGAGAMGGDAEAGTKFLAELDAPYLHPFFMSRRTVRSWRESAQGCSATEVMISLLMPELDGATATIPVGAMSDPVLDADHGVSIEEMTVIEERVERLVTMTKKQIALRKKPNREKRVALICYNYPPGEDNLFGGAFLDTFVSVAEILRRLRAEGYAVADLTVDDLTAHFAPGKAVNSGKYASGSDGMILYDVKKYTPLDEVTAAFGKAPGSVMTEGRSFLIPGMVSGNVFIG
ncbi:MAG: cobaltochelatase subunit CobN, partial [Clostridia bacterium]|nr:cobaltochelatase subunit CobN [Clostridia bacterium]